MPASNSLVATLLAMAGQRNVITIPRAFVRFTGDLESAMLLNQLLYWMPRSHLDGDSIYKMDSEWQEELCLTRYAVRKARETLIGMGFLTTSVHHQKGTPAVHYHIDYETLIEKWEAWLQSDGVKSENELNSGSSKVRKRTLPDESSSNPDAVKFESRQTMNHRVPTENHVGVVGGDASFIQELIDRGVNPIKAAEIARAGYDRPTALQSLDNMLADGKAANRDLDFTIGNFINRLKLTPPEPGKPYPRTRATPKGASLTATKPNIPETTVAPSEMLRLARARNESS